MAGDGQPRRPARSARGDGAPAGFRRRETAERVRLGAWRFLMAMACPAVLSCPDPRGGRRARSPGAAAARSAQAGSEAASRDGRLGHQWPGRWSPYKRATRGWPWRARLGRGSGSAALLRSMGSAGLEAGPRWAEADRVRAWAELGRGQRTREAERGWRGGV
jgi:hypothetical protein